ncbi:hypothetical protein [Streptomyces violaceus]|uniref:hypothetical protein n=1 Tax=Streptomyces violaceus TaxID=1936 RepID=UPI002E233475
MPRISDADRARNEEAIRSGMGRLLPGELPAGGKCGVKTLAAEAGVTSTSPYQQLCEEFERRLKTQRDEGEAPDPPGRSDRTA